MIDKVFPNLVIILSLFASIACFYTGDIRRGIYWLSAAVIAASVTY